MMQRSKSRTYLRLQLVVLPTTQTITPKKIQKLNTKGCETEKPTNKSPAEGNCSKNTLQLGPWSFETQASGPLRI